jgi:ubiquinone/menaquinone biosynthesis C-methylase UbiE
VTEIFDPWPDKYDQWFETPIGKLVLVYEGELIATMLKPSRGDLILDAGCGTGIFTAQMMGRDASVVGLEPSRPMLLQALFKTKRPRFFPVQGDMRSLPFEGSSFDKSVSVTAIEFIENARVAVGELYRVTKPGGVIVVATLNSLSSWARRRREAGKKGHPIFRHAFFRSPEELAGLLSVEGTVETAIHFRKTDEPEVAMQREEEGRVRGLNTGAFVAACWRKP